MKIKLDQNLSRHLKAVLEKQGHDVETVVDEDLAGATDAVVLRAATSEERILFTLDRDFLNLKIIHQKAMPALWCFVLLDKAPLQ